jgi:hypothetical protein
MTSDEKLLGENKQMRKAKRKKTRWEGRGMEDKKSNVSVVKRKKGGEQKQFT